VNRIAFIVGTGWGTFRCPHSWAGLNRQPPVWRAALAGTAECRGRFRVFGASALLFLTKRARCATEINESLEGRDGIPKYRGGPLRRGHDENSLAVLFQCSGLWGINAVSAGACLPKDPAGGGPGPEPSGHCRQPSNFQLHRRSGAALAGCAIRSPNRTRTKGWALLTPTPMPNIFDAANRTKRNGSGKAIRGTAFNGIDAVLCGPGGVLWRPADSCDSPLAGAPR